MKKLTQILQYQDSLTKLADVFDYEKYHEHNIGLTRDQMPQIYNEHFDEVISKLKNMFGVVVERKPLCHLKATQNEVNKDKIKSKMVSPNFTTSDLQFITANCYRIADGHHSHVAGLCIDKNAPAKVYRVNTDIETLINTLNSLNTTDNKSINESKL